MQVKSYAPKNHDVFLLDTLYIQLSLFDFFSFCLIKSPQSIQSTFQISWPKNKYQGSKTVYRHVFYCLDTNLKKNVIKSFSTFGIRSDGLEIMSKYKMSIKEKSVEMIFWTVIKVFFTKP